MGTLWFWIVAAMLTTYVVLDGFDLGVGIIFPFVARTEEERQHEPVHTAGFPWHVFRPLHSLDRARLHDDSEGSESVVEASSGHSLTTA